MEEFNQQEKQSNSLKISKDLLKKLYLELKRLRAIENDSSLATNTDSKLAQRENEDDDYGDESDITDNQTGTQTSNDSSSANDSDYDNTEHEIRENLNNHFDIREEKSFEKPIPNSNALNLFKEKYNIG